MNFKAALVGD